MDQSKHVFVSPSIASVIDYAVMDDQGNWCSLFTGQTQHELSEVYPGVTVTTEAAFWQRLYDQVRTAPEEISQAVFDQAAPGATNRAQLPDSLSYMVRDAKCANVATIFVAYYDADGLRRFARFRDRATLTHREVMDVVSPLMAGGAYDA